MRKYMALGFLCIFTFATSVQAGKKDTVVSTFESVKANVSEKFQSVISLFTQPRPENHKKDTLISAVEDSNAKRVERLITREGVGDENSRKLLVETAEDITDECEESVSLLRSRLDCARFAGWFTWTGLGALLWLKGTVTAITPGIYKEPFVEDKKRVRALGLGSIGALCTAYGVYSLKKAWRCPTASRRLENARAIQDLLKKASSSHASDNIK